MPAIQKRGCNPKSLEMAMEGKIERERERDNENENKNPVSNKWTHLFRNLGM